MNQKIKILHVEDHPPDAETVNRELKKAGLKFEIRVAENKTDFQHLLETFSPDVILCDHSLPSFSSMDALRIRNNANAKIPFILVTGAVSEEFAVMTIKNGADDYILKDRLKRLPKAIENAIEKCFLESERQRYQEELLKNEQRYRNFYQTTPEAVLVVDVTTGKITDYNEYAVSLLKYPGYELSRLTFAELSTPVQLDGSLSKEKLAELINRTLAGENSNFEWMLKDRDSNAVISEMQLSKLVREGRRMIHVSIIEIAERKKAESERNELIEQLSKRNKDLEDWAQFKLSEEFDGAILHFKHGDD